MDAAAGSRAPNAGLTLNWRVTPMRLAILLTLAAIGLRVIGLGIRPLWLDEAYSAWFSARGWHELWTVVPTYETHPPFYYSLIKVWRAVFGGSAVALRLPSVLFGALTVPVTMACALELERIRPSARPLLRVGISGFLAACAPTLIQHGQEARPYALMSLAFAVAVLGMLKLMRQFAAGGPGDWRAWILLAAGTELTLWAHALGVLYASCVAVAVAPAWFSWPGDDRRFARGLLTAAAVALLYCPCLLIIAHRTGDWGSGWLAWRPEMLLQLIGLYAVPAEVLTIISVVATLIMMLLAKRAIQSGLTSRAWNEEKALLLLWWGPPLLTALISAAGMPLFLPRTLTPTLIPCYLMLGSALARTGSDKERLVLTAALIATLPSSSIAMALRPPGEAWDQVSAYLQHNVGPSDLVWLYPNDTALPLGDADPSASFRRRGIPANYPALGEKGPIRAGSPAVVSLTRAGAERMATDPALRTVPTVWLVTTHANFFDPSNEVPTALGRTRRPGPRHVWGYIAAQPFTRR